MSSSTRATIASVLVAGPALVLWFNAPILPVAFGCGLAAVIALIRARRDGSEGI